MTPTLWTVLGTVMVAVIGVVSSAISFCLTKWKEQEAKWQQEKLNHYRVLLSALSDWLGGGNGQKDAKQRFALAVNTIALVAPQDVITALMDYVDQMIKTHEAKSDKLNRLLLAIRRDVGLSGTDDPNTFNYQLVSSK